MDKLTGGNTSNNVTHGDRMGSLAGRLSFDAGEPKPKVTWWGKMKDREWVIRPLRLKFKVKELETLFKSSVYREKQFLLIWACITMVFLALLSLLAFLATKGYDGIPLSADIIEQCNKMANVTFAYGGSGGIELARYGSLLFVVAVLFYGILYFILGVVTYLDKVSEQRLLIYSLVTFGVMVLELYTLFALEAIHTATSGYFIYSAMVAMIGSLIFIRMNWLFKAALNLAAFIIYMVIIGHVGFCLFDNHDSYVYRSCLTREDRVQSVWIGGISLSVVFLTTVILGRTVDRVHRKAFLSTQKTQQESEEKQRLEEVNNILLKNILPEHVAIHFIKEGQSGDSLYAEQHDNICVMFASIPGFWDFYYETDINKGGRECLRLLNEIIADFDELLEKLKYSRVEKIKTIGATYMAAAGLTGVDGQNLHIVSMAKFAFEIQKKLDNINRHSFNDFKLRIGLNHGQVVAGVIGAGKPLYDIWGNTVNVASRMDSTGEPGKIQVSQQTAEVLREHNFDLEERGKIFVKGKGEMTTYFLKGEVRGCSRI